MLLATWNLHLGIQLRGILDALTSLPRPDVMAVQEASIHGDRPDSDLIAESLGPTYRAIQVTAQHLRGAPQANGLVWDTRSFELERMEVMPLPVPGGRLMAALPASQRNFVVAEGAVPGGARIRVHVVHLDVLGIAHKRSQFKAVIDDTAARPPVDLAAIAGDLNTYGVHRQGANWKSLRALAAGAGFHDATSEIRWTQRTFGLRQKLDAIFLCPPELAGRAWAEPASSSDHLPLFLEAEIR